MFQEALTIVQSNSKSPVVLNVQLALSQVFDQFIQRVVTQFVSPILCLEPHTLAYTLTVQFVLLTGKTCVQVLKVLVTVYQTALSKFTSAFLILGGVAGVFILGNVFHLYSLIFIF